MTLSHKSDFLVTLSTSQSPQDIDTQSNASTQEDQEDPNGVIMLEEGKPTGFSIVEPNSVMSEDGRTYQVYDEGKYFLPNDGEEQDRLDLQHAMSRLLLHGKLGWAPVKSPAWNVLDIATGTGIWALEYAREHPESHVVGTDLSLIQPPPDVPNCEFIRENSETADWIFPDLFDYIHIRWTITCFDDPRTVIRKAFDHLEPGGWMEMLDPTCDIGFDDDSATSEEATAFLRYMHAMRKAYETLGRDPLKPEKYKQWLEEVGFVDTQEKVLKCPSSPWPEDPHLKQVGKFWRADMRRVLVGSTKFWQAAGLAEQEAEELKGQVLREMDEAKVKAWTPFYLVYGRKPLESEMTDAQKARWVEMKEKLAGSKPRYPSPP